MSLKGDKYETTEEVKFRLENTVVLYDDEPVYITRVSMPEAEDAGEIARVFFVPLPLAGVANATRKYLSSKKFDLSPFKMGYMNYEQEAVFLSRQPVRQNKQGLSANTLKTAYTNPNRGGGADFGELIRSPSFVDMIKNKYPTFQQVGGMFRAGHKSVALSSSFAFMVDDDLDILILLHKNVKCGTAQNGDASIRLTPKYHYLRQEAEAHGIPIT